jgi:hypothetical protein
MDFQCLKISSSFKEHDLKFPKSGFCKIEFFMNQTEEFAKLSFIFQEDLILYNQKKKYSLKSVEVNLHSIFFFYTNFFKRFSNEI